MLSSPNTTVTSPTLANTASAISTPKTVPTVKCSPSSTVTATAPTIINTSSTTTSVLKDVKLCETTVKALPITDAPSNFSSNRSRTRPVVKITCPKCHIIINKINLQKHIERKHPDESVFGIDDTFQLTTQCIDQTNGIYAVIKVVKGNSFPVHVKYQTWGENQTVCESNECQVNMGIAQKSGIPSYQCMHISAASMCKSLADQVSLKEDILTEMVREKWFSMKKKKQCLALQQLANSNHAPLSVLTSTDVSSVQKFISVFEPSASSYSTLGRVMVVYNATLNTWTCPCTRFQHSCMHKYIAKWHLFQRLPELFSSTHSIPLSEEDSASENNHVYPPRGLGLEYMVNYILQHKKIPAVLPEEMRLPSSNTDYPQSLCPHETVCQECPGNVPLSDPILITQKAKILTNWCIVEDVTTFCKQCPQCGIFYRYQEWKDRLHNFNDHVILDIPLCITLRHLLQVYTSVSRAVEYLQLVTGVEFPPPDTILQAYLQFEALTDHEYKYSCPSCGDHPPVVIMGFHKHSTSLLSENDIEEPPENFRGEVNLETFWETLSKEMICQGLVTDDIQNPFTVPPNYHFWAPWIGKRTRHSDTVLNTEFEKVCPSKSAMEISEVAVTEERLAEELFRQKANVIRSLCNDCGVDSTGSRTDLLLRLANDVKSKETFSKICAKIWSTSGGWGFIMCPCGIVYSLKCNLRAESPQDFADLLLSWQHMPNVMVYDFAQGLATHTNLKASEKMPISPFEGRLMEPTQDNIELAKRGQLKVSLPWLEEKMTMADPYGHPVTGSSEHYILYQDSIRKDSEDALRKVTLVPQLDGKVSGEIAEQLLAKLKENCYFLNMSLPSIHLFQMRNFIHHYNENEAQKISPRLAQSCEFSLMQTYVCDQAVSGKFACK